MRTRLTLLLAFLSWVTSTAFADVPASLEFTGKVIDADSGRPIAGALVVGSVGGDGGSLFGHGHFRKLYCFAVRADAEGRFRIPAWTWSGQRSMDLDPFGAYLVAYHPDYTFYSPGGHASVHQPVRKIPIIGTLLKPDESTIPMHRFVNDGPNAFWFKLGLPLDWYGCDWDGDVRNEDLVWEAMREEVEAYDATNPQHRMKWKLENVTKRPSSAPRQFITPPATSIPAQSPAAPAASAPAGQRAR